MFFQAAFLALLMLFEFKQFLHNAQLPIIMIVAKFYTPEHLVITIILEKKNNKQQNLNKQKSRKQKNVVGIVILESLAGPKKEF